MYSLKKSYCVMAIIFILMILLVLLLHQEKGDEEERSFFEYIQCKIERIIVDGYWPYLSYRRNMGEAIHSLKQEEETKTVCVLTLEELSPKEDKILDTEEEKAGEEILEALVDTEDEEITMEETEKLQRQKVREVSEEEYGDYQALMKNFYTIDASARAGEDLLNAQRLLEKDMRIDRNSEGPQILIYHTHSQEGFVDSVQGDDSTTIMAVGERLAQILETEYGYKVYHHLGKYDVTTRTDAYSRSLVDLEEILEAYPSIQVILDIHRDDMKKENHLVTDIDGKPTAKFMFFNGVSCSRKNGTIDYLYNPNLEENLAFSFQAKLRAEEYYPGLTRRNYIQAYRYNLHLLPRSMLIEVGAQNNTLEEELNACEPLAHILNMVLSGEY